MFCSDINGWLVPREHHAAGRVALFESLRANAVALIESLLVNPGTRVTPETGATLLREADAIRAKAAKFAALPGAVSIGEQAIVALVSDEQSVNAVCLVIDAIIRHVRLAHFCPLPYLGVTPLLELCSYRSGGAGRRA